MGGFLGALASFGMLLLIGLLFCAFLRSVGALGAQPFRRLIRTAGMMIGAACVYWLAGALMYRTLYGSLGSAADIETIFRTAGLEKMYQALRAPSWHAPLSGLFAYLGHGLGALFLGRYLLGGVVLALGMTLGGLCLLTARLRTVVGDEEADRLAFLVLCLPGAVFLFLPGWGPMVFLLAALAFYFAAAPLPRLQISLPPGLYGWLTAVCAVLSAAVVMAVIAGRIG